MPKKRTSAESNYDEQTNEGSESISPKENNAKRAKLDLLSDTTLHDLPFELLECILVKVVAIEVRSWWLAKSEWKEKVDQAMSRLRTVCSQWSSVLTTDSFRTKLQRALDATAPATIRLEVLHEIPINNKIKAVTTLRDEIFILCTQMLNGCVLYVYNRNDMEEVKAVIPLPRTDSNYMAGCNVSNCVYVGQPNEDYVSLSVFRISKDVEQQFQISPWISHMSSVYLMSVSVNGNLATVSFDNGQDSEVISIFDVNGSLQHEIMVPLVIIDEMEGVHEHLIQKSNGNLVFACVNDQNDQKTLLEIDTSGSVVRRYDSSCCGKSCVIPADIYGRIMINEMSKGMQLLDSEFNLLGIYILQQDEGKDHSLYDLHYDNERNEIWRIYYDRNTMTSVLTTFRFTVE